MILTENTQRLTCLKRLCNTSNISNQRKNLKRRMNVEIKVLKKHLGRKGPMSNKKKINKSAKRSTTDPV